MSEGIAFSGTNAYLAKKIQHVSEVFNELISEYVSESAIYQLTLSKRKTVLIAG
jgi:hypothetical protein